MTRWLATAWALDAGGVEVPGVAGPMSVDANGSPCPEPCAEGGPDCPCVPFAG